MTNLEAVREKLEEITRGAGRFSRDPLIHASNTVEDMKELAREALALMEIVEGEQADETVDAVLRCLSGLKNPNGWDHHPDEFLPANVCCDEAGRRRLKRKLRAAILAIPTESGEDDG